MGFTQQQIDQLGGIRIELNTPGGETRYLGDKAYCLTKLRQRPGEFCSFKAGQRTDHRNFGRCFLHGGNSGRKYVLDGRRSRRMEEKLKTIKELAESMLHDPDLLNMKKELAIQKAVVLKLSDKLGSLETIDEKLLTGLRKWIADTVKTIDKIERNQRDAIMTVAQAKYLMSRAIEVQKQLFREWFPEDDEVIQARLEQFVVEWRQVTELVDSNS